ncbi:sialic acid synthase [Contarinia nasturtii]|uniref:sialic acid synthase n=1 Tax=Contarinia nasturtii TaxID=265458 RepID=UPI0012D4547E|nr:sialic acid synthase [Contarinia nasturtii]
MPFNVANRIIGGNRTFVIAEIGQNHQGDIEMAKRLIAEAKAAGADCVKFQKSCLTEKFTQNALDRAYNGVNSWGKTYGEHKEYLEFTIEQYKSLQKYANELDVIFTASAMDIQSLKDLEELHVPVIKIGSGDANNIPLLVNASKLTIPLIISTGMQNDIMVNRIVQIMNDSRKTNYCLLHCVSAYPTDPNDVHLNMLHKYREYFPNITIGYSGHELGIAISTAAVAYGAKVIERHFTLDKQQKGTDHKLSLEPAELKELITRIRSIENSLPTVTDEQTILDFLSTVLTKDELSDVKLAMASLPKKQILDCERPCRMKLGKSLVYRSHLKCGTTISPNDICAKVNEPFGISAEHYDNYLGKMLNKNVVTDENLDESHFFHSDT